MNAKYDNASKKLPIHTFPATAITLGAVGMLGGVLKYGRSDYLVHGVKVSVYYDAIMRHMLAYWSGEDCDEFGVPHLASALSDIAIIIDAGYAGKVEDDRQYSNGNDAATMHMEQVMEGLKEAHADKFPIHYTIQDSKK